MKGNKKRKANVFLRHREQEIRDFKERLRQAKALKKKIDDAIKYGIPIGDSEVAVMLDKSVRLTK